MGFSVVLQCCVLRFALFRVCRIAFCCVVQRDDSKEFCHSVFISYKPVPQTQGCRELLEAQGQKKSKKWGLLQAKRTDNYFDHPCRLT